MGPPSGRSLPFIGPPSGQSLPLIGPPGRQSLPFVGIPPVPGSITDMKKIGRVPLSHEIPPGVCESSEEERFFITICCLPRGENQLAHPEVWQVIDETLRIREANGDLRVGMLLAMPDHLHALLAFPGKKPMSRVMASFKEWVAKKTGVHWQRDFFDHRLRSGESAAEKAAYIRQNPVRAGLVECPSAWPFQRMQ